MDRRTPGYMLRKEIGRKKAGKAGKRAWNFEKKLEEGKGGIIEKKC